MAGFASLMASAYYDIIRGPLLPPIAAELHLAYTDSGAFLALGQIVAAAANLLMIWALNRTTERSVMLVISCVGVAAGVAALLVTGLPTLLVLGGLIGFTISALGTMANILIVEGTPPLLQARMLSALHAMYGIGSMGAAGFVGWALAHSVPWARIYALAIPVYLLLFTFAGARLSRRHARSQVRTVQSMRLSRIQTLAVLTFAVYVAGEATTSMWLTSYLVSAKRLGVSDATPYLSAYFAVLTVVRIGCALWLKPGGETFILRAALVLPLLAFAGGYFGAPWMFVPMGVFGAFFPVYLGRVSRRFPDKWRMITILSLLSTCITIGLSNVAIGRIADIWGMPQAFLVPPLLLLTALVLLTQYLRTE